MTVWWGYGGYMTINKAIHQTQIDILKELLFLPAAGFADMQKIAGLTSDHFKFHIKALTELGLIEKRSDGKYQLTTSGKEYANKLDTDARVIERQPKSAVMLIIERIRAGHPEYLLQQRQKHPLYGFWGVPTGKIRWGESILETAVRELDEETGLVGTFVHRGIYHERVIHDDTNEFVEDKIFHVMLCRDANGTLKEVFEGGRNAWRTLESMKGETKKYKSFDIEMEVGIRGIPFTETVDRYGADEF